MVLSKQKFNIGKFLKLSSVIFLISLSFLLLTHKVEANSNKFLEYNTVDHSFVENFTNESLILSLDTGNGNDSTSFKQDTLMATEIFDFLSKNAQREELLYIYTSFPEGTETTSDVFTENFTKKLITNYQQAQHLHEDGKIGVQTAFDMGYQISITANNKSNDCDGAKIKFEAANSIDYATDNNSINYKSLERLLQCLNMLFSNQDNNIVNKINTSRFPKKLIYEKDNNNNNNQLGIAAMFDLGRRFGLNGGTLEYTDGNTNGNNSNNTKIENPCERLKRYGINTNPNMQFGGKTFNLVPHNPGTLNWKSLKLDEFLGGGRDNSDTISRDEQCIAGTSILVAIVWKIVLFFEGLLAIIAVAMFLYGGYIYLTSAGEETMTEKAKKSILWSIIGIIIVITSRLIATILMPRANSNSVFLDTKNLLTADSAKPGFESIIGITNFILGFVASIAILMIIYGGYLFMMPSGDENTQEKGKTILIQAIIGLIIVILSYTLVSSIFGATDVSLISK